MPTKRKAKRRFYTVGIGREHGLYLIRTGTRRTPRMKNAYKDLPPVDVGTETKRIKLEDSSSLWAKSKPSGYSPDIRIFRLGR